MVDRYAVIGNPVEHSKSPLIHQAFALQTAQDIEYDRVLAPLEGFEQTLINLLDTGYKGANVTVPFKLEAYKRSHKLTDRASHAAAVNTLVFDGQEIVGDNTDGIGLVRDIVQNLNCTIRSKRVLLIGAGGAAEGVLFPLLQERPALLAITNRSMDKARGMATKALRQQATRDVPVEAYEFHELASNVFDLVINATSTGLSDAELPLPERIISQSGLAYDMMYGRQTPFMKWAHQNGALVADGLGMLVEQAAEAFYIWRQVKVQTAPVIAQLRS